MLTTLLILWTYDKDNMTIILQIILIVENKITICDSIYLKLCWSLSAIWNKNLWVSWINFQKTYLIPIDIVAWNNWNWIDGWIDCVKEINIINCSIFCSNKTLVVLIIHRNSYDCRVTIKNCNHILILWLYLSSN